MKNAHRIGLCARHTAYLVCLFLGSLALACSSSSPTPPPRQPFSGSFTNNAWSFTGTTNPRAIVNGSFDFQSCPTLTCHDDYVEAALQVSLAEGQTYTLTYTITGNSPVFIGAVDACSVSPSLTLLLHQTGDNWSGVGAYASYRWYSTVRTKLALGTYTVSIPLALTSWNNVQGQSTDGTGFAVALANLGSAGFVLGGGCADGHGVAVSSGSAHLQINSATIQ